ncbi:MAG TPA: PDR/VanB family oxidoreductase [Trebonia sp.]|jgi:ferredoxin-NADP reductase|nr:PDR/VanB family oxidoreductase [Trebonia sp.]
MTITDYPRPAQGTAAGHKQAALRVRLAARTPLADGVVALSLVPNDPAPLPPWTPGSHIDVRLPGGLVRQYSLCGDPASPLGWRVAVLLERDSRGGSTLVHHVLAEGDELTVSRPRNHFELCETGSYLFIAGGIGITPILPMIAQAERLGRRWRLAYAGRSRATMAFLDELGRYGDKVTLWPRNETGRIDLPTLLATVTRAAGAPGSGEAADTSGPLSTAVYCCGPVSLLDDVARHCDVLGLPAGTLHVERFTPRGGASGNAGDSFEVELASSGQVIAVDDGQSVLSALRGVGVEVLSSCEEGSCGTCETGVLSGVPDHHDTVLTPAERAACDLMMVCVSRSKTPRLVLDL